MKAFSTSVQRCNMQFMSNRNMVQKKSVSFMISSGRYSSKKDTNSGRSEAGSLCIRNMINCKETRSKEWLEQGQRTKPDLYAQEVVLRARSTKSLAKTKFSKNGKKQEFSNYRRLTKANQTGGDGTRTWQDRDCRQTRQPKSKNE